MKNIVRIAGLVAVLMAALTVFAHGATMAQVAEEEVTFTFDGQSLEGPEQLPAGFHIITLQNNGEGSFDLQIVRITGDATAEDIVAAFQAIEQTFMAGGDPVAAINELLEMGDLWGGRVAQPGTSSSVGIDLPEGRYALIGTIHQGGGPHSGEQAGPPALPTYATSTLEVTSGGEVTDAPQVDQTIQMVDFAFALPADIQTGPQMWQVVNRGNQVHHLVLMKLQEGRTMEELQSFMEAPEGAPPVDEVGHVSMLSPGASNYVNFDLEPGTYVALCFVPDHRGEVTGAPHVALGMMQTFTIEGEQ